MDVAVSTAHLPLEYVGVGIAFTIFEDVRVDFEDMDLYSCAVILFEPYEVNTCIWGFACIVTSRFNWSRRIFWQYMHFSGWSI